MILQVQNVTKRFGGLQALTDVTFELPEGQILGLLGPNGAGKTTLFNVINGVYAPEGGRITFRGKEITGWPPYRVAHSGLARTHQVVRPLNELTVRENAMVGACFGRERHSLASAADVADEQGITGQREPGFFGAGRIRDEQGDALGCVTRRMQNAQANVTEFDHIPLSQGFMSIFGSAGFVHVNICTRSSSQVGVTGNVVRMQMCLDDVSDLQSAALRHIEVFLDLAVRVDHCRDAFCLAPHQIGSAPQAFHKKLL